LTLASTPWDSLADGIRDKLAIQAQGQYPGETAAIAHGYDVKGGTVLNLGFTGSSQTGYSANAQTGFDFNQDESLCGNNAPPPHAGVYVAHA
jgi:hypothetical protein